MTPRLLVTGAGGQVGSAIARLARQRGQAVTALARAELDITDPSAVRSAVAASGAEIVINAAAYTNVDGAEDEPGLAHAVNAHGPGYLAAACADAGIPLIHVSTDYVFDGRAGRPYREDDVVAPINLYGASKLEGEEQVRARLAEHVIVRTSWVFAPGFGNFVTTIARLARERESLQVVSDQHGSPTPATALARALLAMADGVASGSAESSPWGTYHVAGFPPVSRFELAVSVVEALRERESIACEHVEPVASGAFPTRAARPENTALDSGLAQRTFGLAPIDWSAALADI